ncbi:MAG: beta-glucosidase, partial [Muribaculaceae bacterium]|nr:beta-glucosidase [Muribaculaceae bacterium]
MKKVISILTAALLIYNIGATAADYPFRDRSLSDDERVDNVISLLTLEEKIALLSTDLGVPRLGIPQCNQVEGLHGLSLSSPGNKRGDTIPSTIFPQAYGLGETWDRDLITRIGAQVAEETRYYAQRPGNRWKALVIR